MMQRYFVFFIQLNVDEVQGHRQVQPAGGMELDRRLDEVVN
jgi:hypothetical protein